jgi:DNA-binding transcriptional ArsR family regulator
MATIAKGKSKKTVADGIENMVYERQATICKAFASPIRLRILDMIATSECQVGDIQQKLGISKPNLSQHLKILRSAGIIATRRDGQSIYCSLAIPEVKQACQLLRKVLIAQIEDVKKIIAGA